MDKDTDFTPISLLQEEILVKIIRIVGHPRSDPHDYVGRLHAIAQVCSTLASIIRQPPSLWLLVSFVSASVRGGTEWVMAPKRPQSSRIAVECLGESGKPTERFWSTFRTHSHR
ncbi:hypothetical protein FRB95_012980 [Tulasnella sp. JGI-2019a]|nr:hypothetical protein FRB95_012980 [Tulasnella sp. JGI-2019a]